MGWIEDIEYPLGKHGEMPLLTVIEERYHGDRRHLCDIHTKASDIQCKIETVYDELVDQHYHRKRYEPRHRPLTEHIHHKDQHGIIHSD